MIGLFGGTFDPIHFGHLRSAIEVYEQFGLTQLRLIPSAQPPHRRQPSVSPSMRMQMLELAIVNQLGITIDSREIDRPGQSYMIDTLHSFRKDFPNASLLLFIGMDAFKNLTSWYQWQHLFDLAHVVVMTRPGFQKPQLEDFFKPKLTQRQAQLSEHKAGCLFFFPVTSLNISATAIRSLIAEKRNPRFLLPDAVIAFINQHGLYNQG